MPLASADPFGGVIITDWYEPPSELRASGSRRRPIYWGGSCGRMAIKVSIFRQVAQSGRWVDAADQPGDDERYRK